MHRLLPILLCLPLLALAGEDEAAARLQRLGRAVEAYRAVYGQPPDSLQQLYARGFFRNFDDVRLPGSQTRIASLEQLDTNGDFALARNDPGGALLQTRQGVKGPQLAYHPGGQITAQGRPVTFTPAKPVERPVERPVDPAPAPVTTERPVVRPPQPPPAAPLADDPLYRQGVEHLRAGRHREAEALLRQAATAQPTIAQYRSDHATALYYLGYFEYAEQGYRAAIQLDPRFPRYHAFLSMALRGQSRYADALEAAGTALAGAPDDPLVLYEVGLDQELLQQYPQALATFRKLVELAPGVADYQYALARTLAWLTQYQAALSPIDHALRLAPARADLHHLRGNLLFNLRDYRAAIPAYSEAIRLLPGNGQAQADLAGACFASGDLDNARRWATSARQHGCQSHWVYQQLGLAP